MNRPACLFEVFLASLLKSNVSGAAFLVDVARSIFGIDDEGRRTNRLAFLLASALCAFVVEIERFEPELCKPGN